MREPTIKLTLIIAISPASLKVPIDEALAVVNANKLGQNSYPQKLLSLAIAAGASSLQF
jgi:hypothetical protein